MKLKKTLRFTKIRKRPLQSYLPVPDVYFILILENKFLTFLFLNICGGQRAEWEKGGG